MSPQVTNKRNTLCPRHQIARVLDEVAKGLKLVQAGTFWSSHPGLLL